MNFSHAHLFFSHLSPNCLLRLAHLLVILSIAVLHVPGAATAESIDPPSHPPVLSTLSVRGVGEVSSTPDQAEFSLAVATTKGSARIAMEENSRKMVDVIAAIVASGIAKRDIETTRIEVTPEYERYGTNLEKTRVSGYRVVNRVALRVRDISLLGALIDRLVRLGVTHIDQLRFTLSNAQKVRDRARAAAAANAKKQAVLLADALDLNLVRILRVSSGSRPEQPVVRGLDSPIRASVLSTEAVSVAAPIARGERATRAILEVIWEVSPR